jgi:hypothetical protein
MRKKVKGPCDDPPSALETILLDIEENENAYKNQNLTREKALQWVMDQLQRKGTFKTYGSLLRFY